MNTGNINGNDIGGFFGYIVIASESPLSTLSIINSANKGNVSAGKGLACGMFCVDPDSAQNLNTTVLNSINKGSVNAHNICIWNHKYHHQSKKCGEHVHDLLNAEVEKHNYGVFWTEELDLIYPHVEPSPSPSLSSSSLQLPASVFSSSQSSQSEGLSGGNKHGVSLFLIGVVVALAAHVAMAQ